MMSGPSNPFVAELKSEQSLIRIALATPGLTFVCKLNFQ